MSVDTTPEQRGSQDEAKPLQRAGEPAEKPAAEPRPPLSQRLGLSFANLEWRQTLLIALGMALAWCIFFLGPSVLQILAGIVPVMAGLFLGRRVKSDWLAHGLVLGGAGFLFGLIAVLAYGAIGQAGIVPMPVLQLAPDAPAAPASLGDLLFFYVTFSLFALIPFPAFGTVMAGRAEQRNRELREQVAERGGKLERPGVVRTVEDLRGLSLPQLGSYVASLYRKKGFEFKDYRFIDKDKHLDLELAYEGESYLLRLTVADKVRPGTIESLVQDMKRRAIAKGVAITSTEFTPEAAKAAAGRRNLVAIDGQTLFEIAEG
jgi:hypothetical protein